MHWNGHSKSGECQGSDLPREDISSYTTFLSSEYETDDLSDSAVASDA